MRRRSLIVKVVWTILIATILIAAGLWIKSKLDDHATALKATESIVDDEVTACRPDQIEGSISWSDTKAGAPVQFIIELTNATDEPCSIDASRQSLVLSVTSGNDQIWNSSFCVGETTETLHVFGEGKGTSLTRDWNGLRLTEDCQSENLSVPGPGTYVVETTIGGIPFPQLRSVAELTGPGGSAPAETEDAEAPEGEPGEGDDAQSQDGTDGE